MLYNATHLRFPNVRIAWASMIEHKVISVMVASGIKSKRSLDTSALCTSFIVEEPVAKHVHLMSIHGLLWFVMVNVIEITLKY
jgi:hypothetical protein